MRHRTATPHGDRPGIEQLPDIDVTPAQQIRHSAMAHKLEGCRRCNGFRIEEVGLGHLISSLDCDRSHRQRGTDGSRPRFASA